MKRYIPSRGDIAWLDFSPQSGHEQARRRPALILSPHAYNSATGLAVVCPITSKIKGHPFEVALDTTLETKGVVLADQLKSTDWHARKAVFLETVSEYFVRDIVARIDAILHI